MILAAAFVVFGQSSPTRTANELVGLWEAKRKFGPEVQGPIEIRQSDGQLIAAVGVFETVVSAEEGEVRIELPEDRGWFRGRISDDGDITGHWVQPPNVANFVEFATPVRLTRKSDGHWHGELRPLQDTMTFFLSLQETAGGGISAFLRNPESNFGRIFDIIDVAVDGHTVRFVEPNRDNARLTGTLDALDDKLTIEIPDAGGVFVFRRVDDDADSLLHARPKGAVRYSYRPPPDLNDGLSVGDASDTGLSVETLEQLVQDIADEPIDRVNAPYIHAVLVAHDGLLVLEEYFHGHSADIPHDTRSASKSVSSLLIGLAMFGGEPIEATSNVWQSMRLHEGEPEDTRKQRIEMRHLLAMTPGLACDDNDQDSPGTEWRMQSQSQVDDWAEFTLALPMVHEPGAHVSYCSGSTNLALSMLGRQSGQWLPTLFHRYVAEPLRFANYGVNLMPNREAYGGGGLYVTARDFLKIGQLMLGKGQWNGQRLASEAWIEASLRPYAEMFDQGYGYAWWLTEFDYGGTIIPAYYAGGNGGQYIMVLPDQNMVIVFMGANYGQRETHLLKTRFVPDYLVPALFCGDELADALCAPASDHDSRR